MMPVELAAVLAAIAGVVVSLNVIWQKAVKPMFKFVLDIREIHELVQELKPNGGGSVKDDVRHMREMLERHMESHTAHGNTHPSSDDS